mmetsp:Transcript_6458/g.9411  ORF Transcript_6458/g.9411 Transcript_6458/m.9411 type:complete len:120 (+) Transcript_6458:158-517(+)|eukprot:CAMPEP_0195518260 /NCGR_PEP_ID=MMETSP0794_2-20130614/12643_1 /TAXON_ID=515487 /ORGANISM="Stephanopyxis turris, Strain CCMP 815" /LENGTH=119 /DNA_ID=CAMNT_0040647199 /DNA_START=148 /DNA_END=507 /DNA_ORIENTATION=-
MSQTQQEDGYYPRLNSSMINSGNYTGMIVSVVGNVIANDGQTATVKCADGNNARVFVDPDFFAGSPNCAVEVIGAVNEDRTLQHFVTRELGIDFDLSVYNQMIVLQQDPKYSHIFSPST